MAKLAGADKSGSAMTLGLAFPPELSCVPWPIVCFGTSEKTKRLVEYAAIRVWTTLGIEESREPELLNRGCKASLLLDNPKGLLRVANDELVQMFSMYLASTCSEHQFTATKANLLNGLRLLRTEPDQHLAVIRSHAVSEGDPAYAAIETSDEPLYAGELFGFRASGEPAYPMPHRVLLACCSSGTTGERFGSSVGLAAGCIVSGAQAVVATGIDVYDSSFTNALDVMLATTLTRPGRVALLVRELHLRLLAEWKKYSTRGLTDSDDDIVDPHPVIWAYFWPF
jgi:hypothetical protein